MADAVSAGRPDGAEVLARVLREGAGGLAEATAGTVTSFAAAGCRVLRALAGCPLVLLRMPAPDGVKMLVVASSEPDEGPNTPQLYDAATPATSSNWRSPTLEAYRTGVPSYADGDRLAQSDDAADGALGAYRVRSIYCVPVTSLDHVIGVLVCYWDRSHQPDDGERQLAVATADILGSHTARLAYQATPTGAANGPTAVAPEDAAALIRMIDVLASGGPNVLERVTRLLAQVLHHSVAVTGPDGDQVARVLVDPKHATGLAEAAERGGVAAGRPENSTVIPLGDGASTSASAHLSIVPAVPEASPVFAQVVVPAARLIAVQLRWADGDQMLRGLAKPLTLLALCSGETNPVRLREAREVLGVDDGTQLTVAVVDMPTPESAFRLSAAAGGLREHGWKVATSVATDAQVIILIRGDLPEAAANALIARHPDARGLGVSAPSVHGVTRLVQAYEQAALALASTTSRRRVGYFARLSPFAELATEIPAERVAAYVGQTLRGLTGGSRENHDELLRTLTEYVEADGAPREACRRLDISEAVLEQRLRRIATLTGLDPTRLRDSARLCLALDWRRLSHPPQPAEGHRR